MEAACVPTVTVLEANIAVVMGNTSLSQLITQLKSLNEVLTKYVSLDKTTLNLISM